MCAGLAAFVVISNPPAARTTRAVHDWLIAAAIIQAGRALLHATASLFLARRPATKAALAGTASGILFGLAAALTKATVDRLDDGVFALLGDWHVYALVAVALPTFWLTWSPCRRARSRLRSQRRWPSTRWRAYCWACCCSTSSCTSRPGSPPVSVMCSLLVALAGLIVLARGKHETEPPGLRRARPRRARARSAPPGFR